MKKIGKLAVIGVGLIGGSFALALKKRRAVGRVVGVGRSRANLLTARRLRIIDEIATDDAAAVADADLVLLAVPAGQMAAVLTRIAPHLGARTVLTDAGSTKQDVIAAARAALGPAFARFVPAHPVAGTENSGARAAFAGLYAGRSLIVTPEPETDARALRVVAAAWRNIGARVFKMSAAEHDRVFALISHLPHLVSFALVGQIADQPDARTLFGHSGGGFRDMSRIAASSPEMWRDIVLANRGAVLPALDAYLQETRTLRDLIAVGDGAGLEARFTRAREARRRWLKEK
ncbi:MAG TPA: prephenate dehydrogenase/arogenate dehydrogenase family protein [Burkholderiales bacterium]|nr:prephenate dehydrogenase/arogenate dehydrogenase family protein [Burkholderiales bacterium]